MRHRRTFPSLYGYRDGYRDGYCDGHRDGYQAGYRLGDGRWQGRGLAGRLGGLLVAGFLFWAGAAAGGPEVGSANRSGEAARSKPPVRLLEQTLMLGGVPPRDSLGAAGSWSEVRAGIVAEFKPTAELITGDNKAVAVAKQLTRGTPLTSGPPTLAAAAVEPTGELDPVAQTDAARQVFERPVNLRTVELAAFIEEDGRLSAVEVLIPSGNRAFDQAAIAAVRAGFRARSDRLSGDRGPPDRRLDGRLMARLRVTAGRAVTLPRVVPLREPPQQNLRLPSRGFVGTSTMHFDETSGAVSSPPPFSNRLSTQVELISVAPAPPAPASPSPPGPAAP